MPARGRGSGGFRPYAPPQPPAGVQEGQAPQPRYVGRETLVERIYASIIAAIESGENVDDVVNRYMPLLLNEVDEMALTFPEVKSLFFETFRELWEMRFKTVPMPDVDEEGSAEGVLAAVLETLAENADKLQVVGSSSKTAHEVRQAIAYAAVRFMEAVCRHFFRVMGVLT